MNWRHVRALIPSGLVLLGGALSGCIARSAPPGPGLGSPAATPPSASPSGPTPRLLAATPPSSPMLAPPGYVPMHASEVVPTQQGEAVLLLDQKETVVLPIFIGGSEATSIRLRLAKRRFERPLTHDLLDALMHETGAQLVRVQVDDLKSSTFLGSVFVQLGGRILELDARPSDAIALALGNHAPIFVACRVIEQAAIPRASLREEQEGPPATPPVEGCPPKPTTNPALRSTGI